MKSLHTIAITGGTGYIGRHLVAHLMRMGGFRIKILTRSKPHGELSDEFAGSAELIAGDLHSPETLKDFLEYGCTVIHLAYLYGSDEAGNLLATRNLLAACNAVGVKRLVHCSTAAVVGRTRSRTVSEGTPCQPTSAYGVAKLKIEDAIRAAQSDGMDVAILRPTAVFGAGGGSLNKLVGDLFAAKVVRNYLKSCLFNKRRMNLVYVENVVAALSFMILFKDRFSGGVYIISQDDEPSNNFAAVEDFFMSVFPVRKYPFPRLPISLSVLSFLLTALNRNDADPRRNYDSSKLLNLGFVRPVDFNVGLRIYADWYQSTKYL